MHSDEKDTELATKESKLLSQYFDGELDQNSQAEVERRLREGDEILCRELELFKAYMTVSRPACNCTAL